MVCAEFSRSCSLQYLHACRHEELYEGIEETLIRSDELPDTLRKVSVVFDGIKLVLSTLTMLSNPKLQGCGLFRFIPVKSLVIDEASQIDIFEFMVTPLFELMRNH
jgi:hypothetical protein